MFAVPLFSLLFTSQKHAYIILTLLNWGLQGYTLFFLFLLKKIDCGYSSTYNLCFDQKYEKYQIFLSENFQFLEVKFSIYLNRRVFVMNEQNNPIRSNVFRNHKRNYLCSPSKHALVCI